jgi:hypothetical protein
VDTLNLFIDAAWKVFVWSMLLGAGLVAIFAVGVRMSSPVAQPDGAQTAVSGPGTKNPLGSVVAVACFAVVLAGVALGLTYIIASGQGKVLSFDHGYPTLAPKP